MKINLFDQGLSTRKDPILLGPSDAVAYSNIDNTTGLLKSAQTYTPTAESVDTWFYNFNDVWYSSANERTHIEYNNKLYYTEDNAIAGKVSDGIVKTLGIDAPVDALTAAEGGAGTISSSGEDLQYTYTYYDSVDGVESAPSPISTELALSADKEVDITDLVPSTNPAVNLIRIYRLGAGTTEFTLLAEIDNADTTYTDNISSVDLLGTILDTNNNQPPLNDLRYLSIAYGMLFASIGNRLYYSRVGLPDAWPTNNYILFNDVITGILPVQDGILVFTLTTVQVLVGSTAADFNVLPVLSKEHGCVNHKSCRFVKRIPVWVSQNGVCIYQGGRVELFSQDKLGQLELDIVNTAVHNEQYYICKTDGSLLVVDFRFGGAVFKNYTLPSVTVDNVGNFVNVLYGVIDGVVATLFDGDQLEFTYLSPEFTEGDATVLKGYNNIYIRANGEFELTIYIDGVIVSRHTLTGDTIHDVTPPQEKQTGSSIQFGITGVGTIKEIEYKVLGRQNGR